MIEKTVIELETIAINGFIVLEAKVSQAPRAIKQSRENIISIISIIISNFIFFNTSLVSAFVLFL